MKTWTYKNMNLWKYEPTKTQTYENKNKTILQKTYKKNKPTKKQTYEITNLRVASGSLTTYTTPELDLIV